MYGPLKTNFVLFASSWLIVAGCSAPPDPRRNNFEIKTKDAYSKYDPK